MQQFKREDVINEQVSVTKRATIASDNIENEIIQNEGYTGSLFNITDLQQSFIKKGTKQYDIVTKNLMNLSNIQLGLLRNSPLDGIPFEYSQYAQKMVNTENATFITPKNTLKTIQFLKREKTWDDTKLLFLSDAGLIDRTDNIQKFYRTAFDISTEENDLDGSETASQQPRLVGGIAPNSKPSASNQNGEERFFTHPEISFGAGDAWSLTICIQDYGGGAVERRILGSANTSFASTRLLSENLNFTSYTTPINFSTGKRKIVTWVADGSGGLKTYVNGGITNNMSGVDTNVIINRFIKARDTAGVRQLIGIWNFTKLQSSALTAQQVTAEHNYLRSIYPEIESTVIGEQEWSTRNFEAVATPEGAVIQNVTDNATWADATNIYDSTVGTEREKLIAAAMWCYFNNDVNLGATYGKLYNWYAVKLLDLDMESSGYGWRVPTGEQFTTLISELGGESVAGGKLKMTGLDYWISPNEGATNESGFTALGSGRRRNNGNFQEIVSMARYWRSDFEGIMRLRSATSLAELLSNSGEGASIRLIKEVS